MARLGQKMSTDYARDTERIKRGQQARNVSPECWRNEHELCECNALICRCECHRVELEQLKAKVSAGRTPPMDLTSHPAALPDRIRVCIRAGKEDWIGVAYAAETGDPSEVHEYVLPNRQIRDLDESLFHWLTEFRQRRQKVSDDAVKNLGSPDKDTPKWMDVDHLLRIIDDAEARLLFSSDVGRNQQHRVNELERCIELLLRYVDHQRGCTSYTNGPCTCGFEGAMRDPAIGFDNSTQPR